MSKKRSKAKHLHCDRRGVRSKSVSPCELQLGQREFKMCSNKAHYFSRADARRGQREAMKKDSGKTRIYRCPYCGEYHLTTSIKEEQGGYPSC